MKKFSFFAFAWASISASVVFAADLTYTSYSIYEDGNVTATTVTIAEANYENFNASASNTLI